MCFYALLYIGKPETRGGFRGFHDAETIYTDGNCDDTMISILVVLIIF